MGLHPPRIHWNWKMAEIKIRPKGSFFLYANCNWRGSGLMFVLVLDDPKLDTFNMFNSTGSDLQSSVHMQIVNVQPSGFHPSIHALSNDPSRPPLNGIIYFCCSQGAATLSPEQLPVCLPICNAHLISPKGVQMIFLCKWVPKIAGSSSSCKTRLIYAKQGTHLFCISLYSQLYVIIVSVFKSPDKKGMGKLQWSIETLSHDYFLRTHSPKGSLPPSKSGNRYIDCLVRDLANSVTGTTPFPPADPQQKPSTFFQFTPEIIMRLNCGRLSFRNCSIYPNRKCTGFLLVSISMQQPTRLWLRAGAVLG